MYLIIFEDYSTCKVPQISQNIKNGVSDGEIIVIDMKREKQLNGDGDWFDIRELKNL